MIHLYGVTMQNVNMPLIGLDELSQIINNSPAVTFIWKTEPHLPVAFVTDNVERLTGYSPEEFISGSMTYKNFMYCEDVERVFNSIKAFTDNTKCTEFELEPYRILTRKGELKWMSERTFIKRDKLKKIIHYQAVLLDITDQKKYEILLRDTETRVSTTFNAISDSVMLHPFSEEGFKSFIEVNDTACKRYNYSREEFLNLTAVDITDFTDDKNQESINLKKAFAENKNFIFETVHKTKSGESFPVEINSTVIDLLGQKVILSVIRDITERKKIEESLLISQYSLDKAAIGAFCMNPAGNIFNANDEAARMLGYTKEELESICLFDLDPMVTRENDDGIWQTLVNNGKNYFESLHRKKDGTLIPVEIFANLLDYNGKIYSISFSRDISKRKEAEKKLSDTVIQLQAIYNNLPVTLWATDKNGIFTLSEGLSLGKQGFKPGELVGTSIYDVYKDYPLIIENVRRAHKGEMREYDIEVQGIIFHSLLTPIIDEHGNFQGTNGIAVDITDKRKIEDELYHLQNYLTNIINSMPSALIGVDSAGCITQWNKTVEDFTDIMSNEAHGEKLSFLLPQMEPEMEKILKSIEYGQIVQEHKRTVTINKNAAFEEMTIYPLLTNNVKGAVIRVDNVTEKVRLEEMIIQSEKMLSVGGLAAGMAHEINNPLAGMLQSVSVLANRLRDNDEIPANRKAAEELGTNMNVIENYMKKRGIYRMMDVIHDSGKRIADIVENMLSFSRQSNDFVSSHDLNDLLDKTLELANTDYDLRKNWDFKKIKISREYATDLKIVPCEKVKIQQVLLNLFKNGAQAMQDTGASPPEFIIRTYNGILKNMVCIEIEDNGPGMKPEISKRIFEPFFTTKPVGVGTGLGLSVSYFIIVENHHGEMEVTSIPGSGTTFTIRLPIERR